jgi:hypothetical protein
MMDQSLCLIMSTNEGQDDQVSSLTLVSSLLIQYIDLAIFSEVFLTPFTHLVCTFIFVLLLFLNLVNLFVFYISSVLVLILKNVHFFLFVSIS